MGMSPDKHRLQAKRPGAGRIPCAEELRKVQQKADRAIKKMAEREDNTRKAMISVMQRAKRRSRELKETKTLLNQKTAELQEARRRLDKFNSDFEERVNARTIQLVKEKDKVQKFLDVQTRFVSQVAHDLRTPLTPILALLPIIKKRVRDNDSIEKIDLVMGNANYLSALVRDTLSISKLDSGTVTFNRRPEDLHEIISSVIDNNSIVFKTYSVKTINMSKKSIPLVAVDRVKIVEVFENLVMNATKYLKGRKKREIRFDAKVQGSQVLVRLSDTGEGIPAEHIGRIFDEFYRVDPSAHDRSSGLGLAICKRIITRHGGKIWAESKGTGKGTTFCFTLPIYKKTG